MDAPAFDAKRFVRLALRSIVVCFSVVVISSMTMVKSAQAEGAVSPLPAGVYADSGRTRPISGYSSTGAITSANHYYPYATGLPGTFTFVQACITGVFPDASYYVNSWAGNSYGGDAVCYFYTTMIVPVGTFILSCPANSSAGPRPTIPSCTCNTDFKPDPTATSCVSLTCPAHASGTPCACDAGFVPNASGSCDAEVLTITLSGGTSTEPWHKKWDQEHTNANLPYTAAVKNQIDQPKPGIGVNISSDVTPGSGGHAHDNGRPKGKLVASASTANIKDGTNAIQGATDSNGVFSFTFGAEEASGEHTITATCTGCSNTATATIKVEIPSLIRLDAAPLSYELRGETDPHPGNHYFSDAAMVQIINLAFAYSHDPAFNNQLLKINDSSLIKGGTFDVLLDWTSLTNVHGGHRVGIVVDINNYTAPDPYFVIFSDYFGIQANWHGKGTGPHYHLLLLGKGKDH